MSNIKIKKDINVTIIQGINSMYYIEYDNKKYYMFGDLHDQTSVCDGLCDYHNYTFDKTFTYNTNCTTITALLHNWFLYNNKHDIETNVYMEETFTKEDTMNDNFINARNLEGHINTLSTIKPKYMSWMQLTNIVFEHCLKNIKYICPFYPNVKMHYVDIRVYDHKRISPFYINDIYHDINMLNPTMDETYKIKKYVVNIIETLIFEYDVIVAGLLDSKEFDTLVDIISNILPYKVDYLYQLSVKRNGVVMYRVAAELQKLLNYNNNMYKKVVLYIYGLIDDLMEPVRDDFDDNVEIIFDNFGTDVEYNMVCIDLFMTKYHNVFTTLSAYIMDAYVLARLFTQEGEENIIYAGAAHIDVYKDFFKQLNTTVIIEHNTNDIGCVTDDLMPMYLNVNKYRLQA